MGRNPIKENQNPYFRARKQAAEWDARLESRERASELIGIAAYTLADYELGNVKRVPADKVLIMADLYNAPWLLSNYCKNECPICGFLPLATEEKNICSVTVRLLKALREDELENMKNQLLEISQDGKIRDDEVEAVRKISEYLDGIAEVISEFKIMDWKCTQNYVRAFAEAEGVKLRLSWRVNGFFGELYRIGASEPVEWLDPDTGEVRQCRLSRNYLKCQEIKEKATEDMETELKKLGYRMKFPAKTGDLSRRWCSAYLKIMVADTVMSNLGRLQELEQLGGKRHKFPAKGTA